MSPSAHTTHSLLALLRIISGALLQTEHLLAARALLDPIFGIVSTETSSPLLSAKAWQGGVMRKFISKALADPNYNANGDIKLNDQIRDLNRVGIEKDITLATCPIGRNYRRTFLI